MRLLSFFCLFWMVTHLQAVDHLKRNYSDIKGEPKVVFFTSQRSGSHLLACNLVAVLRRPVGFFARTFQDWVIHENTSYRIKGIKFISMEPFCYHTHEPSHLIANKHEFDKLILVTRNPKELIFRNFDIRELEDLDRKEVQRFLEEYLERLVIYERWSNKKRVLFFYEDMITNLNKIISDAVNFIDPYTPSFFQEYLSRQQEYLKSIWISYVDQFGQSRFKNQTPLREGGWHGQSCETGADPFYYTKNQNKEILRAIDELIKKRRPKIWEKYLKRFEEK